MSGPGKKVKSIFRPFHRGMGSSVYSMKWTRRVSCISKIVLLRSSGAKVRAGYIPEYSCGNSKLNRKYLPLPAGRQWFIRSALITSLPDDIINTTVVQFAETPVGCSTSQAIRFIFMDESKSDNWIIVAWLFELAGGAIADFEDTCLPKAQREAAFTIAALHQWDMGVDDPRCIAAAEDVGVFPCNFSDVVVYMELSAVDCAYVNSCKHGRAIALCKWLQLVLISELAAKPYRITAVPRSS
jgi:hypothetical protein